MAFLMGASPEWVSVVIPVFRDAVRARSAIDATLQQSLPDGFECEVIAVDDGSDDDSWALLNSCKDPRVRVLRLPYNQGRSVARNAGVKAARGSFVVFMDCDCMPNEGYVSAHLAQLISGAVASTGHVAGAGGGFWDRYQSEASFRRKCLFASGSSYAGVSSNLAVRKSVFMAVNGFEKGYLHYGFEDRDLLLRMSKRGRIAWAEGASVRHLDSISLSKVAAKMAEAGEHSSQIFAAKYPEAYRRLGYAAIDIHTNPGAKIVAPLSAPIAIILARAFDALYCNRWLPYIFAKGVVKITSALSYLGGTASRVDLP